MLLRLWVVHRRGIALRPMSRSARRQTQHPVAGSRRPQIDGGKQRCAAFRRDFVAASQLHERHAFRDEVADPTLDANGHAIHFGQGAQPFDVDESDVAGSLTCNRNIQLAPRRIPAISAGWNGLRGSGINSSMTISVSRSDAVDDVVYADRVGNMINKVDHIRRRTGERAPSRLRRSAPERRAAASRAPRAAQQCNSRPYQGNLMRQLGRLVAYEIYQDTR